MSSAYSNNHPWFSGTLVTPLRINNKQQCSGPITEPYGQARIHRNFKRVVTDVHLIHYAMQVSIVTHHSCSIPGVMPPKKAMKATTKCDVCDAAIVEGKEDVLQCEGACQMWFHHYCAGVSLNHFRRLPNTSKPFVCSFCSSDVYQALYSMSTPVGDNCA